MKALSLLIPILFSSSFAWAVTCPTLEKNTIYTITERFFAIGNDFEIKAGKKKIGLIKQKIFNWGTTFEMLNESEQLIARAEQRVFALGVKIDIYDCNHQIIGKVQEEIFKSLLRVRTIYSLLDEKDQDIGKSKKIDWIGTDVEFFNNTGNSVATLERPFINLITDKWTLVLKNNSVDPRLLFFTAAYKTAADNYREAQAAAESLLNDK